MDFRSSLISFSDLMPGADSIDDDRSIPIADP